MKKGFTLIELLIVVAIIAILAAIAVPNFLEAQTRSKVSRVKADFRSLATALDAYCIDFNTYPIGAGTWVSNQVDIDLAILTTPIAFMTSVGSKDPFQPLGMKEAWCGGGQASNKSGSYLYFNLKRGDAQHSTWATMANLPADMQLRAFVLTSNGPDRLQGALEWIALGYKPPYGYPDNMAIYGIYDPTNGTASTGDIGRTGGESRDARAGLINR